MPHLSKLAKQYEGQVTFVALSDESISKIEGFLGQKSPFDGKTWAQAMEFAVATDSDGSVKESIFTAAGQRGIPASFIIAGGKVQWIGHPMGLDTPLAQVVDGSYDLEKAKKRHAAERATQQYMEGFRPLFAEARSSGNWDNAVAYLDTGLEKFPEAMGMKRTKWSILLLHAKRYDDAYAFGEKYVRDSWDDAMTLNEVAWTVVDDESVERRDLDFALRVAERAAKLTDEKDGAILDTLARVHYEAGRHEEAIRWQRKAVKHAEGAMKEQLIEVLEKYEAKQEKKGSGTSL